MFSKIAVFLKQLICKHEQIIIITTRTKKYKKCLKCKYKRKIVNEKIQRRRF